MSNLHNWVYDVVLKIKIVRDENQIVPVETEKMEEIHDENPSEPDALTDK